MSLLPTTSVVSESGSEVPRSLLPDSLTLRLFVLELRRLMLRKLFWAIVLLGGAVGAINIYQYRPMPWFPKDSGDELKAFGVFTYYGADVFVLLVPLIAGLAAAGSLAADRRLRYCDFMLIRGVSRKLYLLTKAAAMSVAAGLATTIVCGIVVLTTMIFFPWGSTKLVRHPRESPTATLVDPFPGLFQGYPLASDLLLIALFSLATASLTLTGLVIGSLVAREYAAASFPFVGVIVLGSLYGDPSPVYLLSPLIYLDIQGEYGFVVPSPIQPFAMFVYWVLFGVVCVAMGLSLFLRRELE